MKTVLIKEGRVVDPSQGLDQVLDLVLSEGRVVHLGSGYRGKIEETFDARGLVVCPGFIDMHVHLREPGGEEKETLETGLRAALAGGFTSVTCMANTQPAIDNKFIYDYVERRARELSLANVLIIGAVTKNLEGKELADLVDLHERGAVAFSDDGREVVDSHLLLHALRYTRMFGKPLIAHCEEPSLAQEGIMNEGAMSARLGLKGIPNVAESIMVYRQAALAAEVGAQVHIAHLSTRESLEVVSWMRSHTVGATPRGCPVSLTCEVTPHHLLLTDDELKDYDPRFKMNPPLRSYQDVSALQKALKEGKIDAIASDHAPHSLQDKDRPLQEAPFGVIGLETTVSVLLTRFVHTGELSLSDLVQKLTRGPAQILHLSKGSLALGSEADVTLLDLNHEGKIDASQFHSKARHTPFEGWKVRGKVVAAFVQGQHRYSS